jgi:hypothetical protein
MGRHSPYFWLKSTRCTEPAAPLRPTTKQAPSLLQTALVGQFRVFKIIPADAATAGNVLFHQAQPLGLLGLERRAALRVVAPAPGLKALVYFIGKGFEW